jgi:hypothetical protein
MGSAMIASAADLELPLTFHAARDLARASYVDQPAFRSIVTRCDTILHK